MDLAQLKFDVDTSKLLAAKDAIDGLASSMNNLNKVQQEETKSATDAIKAKKDVAKATEESTQSSKNQISVLDKQKSILDFMTQGYSKGQSSILAYAKANGAAMEEIKALGDVLSTQRKLIGGEPFDKSMSGLVALKNQYGEVREAIRQYNSSTELTKNQTRELARDKERIIEKMKLEGASFSQIKTAIKDYNSAYIDTANKVNSLIAVEKEREKVARDTTNAVRNVQAAEERLFASVVHLNDGISNNTRLNERAAMALGSYERNLRLAGITGEQAAAKLAKFKMAQEQLAAVEAQSRSSFVARGVGVQMGDVAVSLASGMNPLTVAIQQGDQIRGLLQQSGLEAAQMGKVMQQAVSGIVASFKDVGVAVGSFVLGGFKSLGDASYRLVNQFVNLDRAALAMANTMVRLGVDPLTALTVLERSTGALRVAFAALGTAGVLALSGLAIGFYKAVKESDNLAKSLALNSEKIILSHYSAMQLVESLRELGVTSFKSTEAIAAMAETGGFTKDQFELVAKSAADMNKYFDVAISETVKKFAELKKDPMQALIDLAGVIDSTTYENILRLIEQGKTIEAQKAITIAYADVNNREIARVKQDYSGLTLAIIEWGSQISQFFDKAFKSLGTPQVDARIKQIEEILNYRKQNPIDSFVASFLGVSNTSLENELAALKATKDRTAAQEESNKKQEEGNKLRAEASKLWQSTMSAEEKYLQKTTELQEKAKKALALGDVESANRFTEAQGKLAEEYVRSAKNTLEYKARHEELNASKKEANKIDTYYKTALEKVSDLNIKNTKTILDMTKAEQLRVDLQNDSTWKLLPERLRDEINARIDNAKKIELENKLIEEQKELQKEFMKIQSDYQIKAQESLNEIKNKTILLTLTEEQKQITEALLKVEQERIVAIEKIREAGNKKIAGGGDVFETTAQMQSQINATNKFYDQQLVYAENLTLDYQEQANKFETGWTQAFNSYTSAAKNSAEIGKKAFESMTNGMADALTEWAMTGKLTVKDFANSFIREMIRAQMQSFSAKAVGGLGSVFSSIIPSLSGFGGSFASSGFSNLGSGLSLSSWSDSSGYSWSSGGYTGPGGTNDPAGIVHKGEVVWSQQDVANAGGVSVVEAMRKGLRGYAIGGLVGASSTAPSSQTDSPVTVNITISSDGNTKVETNPLQEGNRLGKMIATVVKQEILKEKRDGGLLSRS